MNIWIVLKIHFFISNSVSMFPAKKKKTRFNCIYVSFEHDNICGKRDDFKILLTQKFCVMFIDRLFTIGL
jgi:hypothetical protein